MGHYRACPGELAITSRLGGYFAACLIVGGLLVILPNASAAPGVLPVSSSAYSVQATDHVVFAGGGTVNAGTTINLTAPDGRQAQILRGGVGDCSGPANFTLAGVGQPGCPSPWTFTGNLVGAAGDGTWTITIGGGGVGYESDQAVSGGPVILRVGSRTLSFGAYTMQPATMVQTWNWRSTTATWVEPSTNPSANVGPTVDTPTEAAEEDPNNAVFFTSAQSPFTAYTLHYGTPTCGPPATDTVNGAWLGATGTVFSRFTYVDGNFIGTDDLRTILGFSQTAEENEGAISNGTDSKTISYNNAAGTSYQFMVRNSTGAEALGTVQWIPNGLCTIALPGIGGLTLNQDQFHMEVSQAQCANDAVSFALENDGLFTLLTDDTDVFVVNTTSNLVVFTIDDAQMFATPSATPLIHYFSEVFPPGAYVAIAVFNQVVGTDYFEAQAFNVPRGSCVDSPTDLSPVLLALNSVQNITLNHLVQFWADYNATALSDTLVILAAITSHDLNMTIQHQLLNSTLTEINTAVQSLNLTVDCGSTNNSCSFFIDNDTLAAILQNITEHRNHSLDDDPMSHQFGGLGFDGFLTLLFWIAALLFFSYQRWLFAFSFTLPGLLEVLFPTQIPEDFAVWFTFCLFGVVLEVAANRFGWGPYKQRS